MPKQAETPPRIGFSGHSASVTTVAGEKRKEKKKSEITRLSDARNGKYLPTRARTAPTPRSSVLVSATSTYTEAPRGARVRMLVSTRIITCLVHHKQRTWPDVMRRGPTQNPSDIATFQHTPTIGRLAFKMS